MMKAAEQFKESLRRFLGGPKTHAQQLARTDLKSHSRLKGRHFSLGNRPVIRWIKGNGLDDDVTRAAIAHATRLFGDRVDYCLCTNDIHPARLRHIVSLANQPVEWWPVSASDNPALSAVLQAAGCPPEHFGYWWKWFPERVRPDGPEWILDGDMVIIRQPPWFESWVSGDDVLRVAQVEREGPHIYGRYADFVDHQLALYSGLVSLPPGLRYMDAILRLLQDRPLAAGHDGRSDMCEQGVIAACFQTFGATPIPLNEFPFGRAFEHELDFGLSGEKGRAWGYHFGHAFRQRNHHFDSLIRSGTIPVYPEPDSVHAARWLGGLGQWGVPGWSLDSSLAARVLHYALDQPARDVLEIGTSRGHLTSILAANGFEVTTVDHVDRGARQNLAGMNVHVVIADVVEYLSNHQKSYGLIVVDLHGNSPADWQRFRDKLMLRLEAGGMLLVNNAVLDRIPEWKEETGVRWFLEQLPSNWSFGIDDTMIPGLAIVRKN
ncbi:hypothetical protein [Aestuariivirga sp.]|jgi:hypothetical protein|uniref:hypothetical protein n=1 Tax=Aestuariivirga sp. TaxID=2650926 RepID=UPI0037846131